MFVNLYIYDACTENLYRLSCTLRTTEHKFYTVRSVHYT